MNKTSSPVRTTRSVAGRRFSAGEERGQSTAPGGWVVGKLVERAWDWLGRIEEVPAEVVHGMRKAVARDGGGGRERDVRGGARR